MRATEDQRQLAKQTRTNPLRYLTPATLVAALDNFETGWLRSAALLWETLEKRVPVICNAAGKRRRSVSRRPWEVITTEESPAATDQKEFIESLFYNLKARDAVRADVKGGVSLLIKQMMGAIFHRYALHELVWSSKGGQLKVECVFVPLWFFEETTGALRYTGPLYSGTGKPLEPGEWMVTSGDGIMEAISTAYIFWKLSLEDAMNHSERFGSPGVMGRTRAAKGSDEGNAMEEAVAAFGTDYEGVIYGDDGSVANPISLIESSRTGDGPFDSRIEHMEKTIVALCRGADLGTLSSKDATGASLQGEESDILEQDDCELISETLQEQVVLFALRWKYGASVEPLVKIQITPSATADVAEERATDEFLIKHGVEIAKGDLAERYGRTQKEETEEKAGTAPEAPAENSIEAEILEAFQKGLTES